MVEVEHRVTHGKVRIPLAGPANRQGRIAAENALGGSHAYHGSLGTSIVRVFDAVAGMTGLSLKAARATGLDVESVTVHKEHHTAYYPGSKQVTVKLVYERGTGRILGGQTVGYAGADRRLDVIAVAAFSGMTVHELADVDFAYSPPLGTANDVMNMVAYVAENRLSGYGPSLAVEELDAWVAVNDPVVLDVRDSFAFDKSHLAGAIHLPLEVLPNLVASLPANRKVLVYDETGKKGHQAMRFLLGARGGEIVNVSGGHQSLQRYQRAVGFTKLDLPLLPVVAKSLKKSEPVRTQKPIPVTEVTEQKGRLVVDVRTPAEFAGGAYPGAINIPLDEVQNRVLEFGSFDREIMVYCASGGRSGYAFRILSQLGFKNLTNGGGIAQVMQWR